MKRFTLINNISGWIVFAIAAFTYLLTIEPTASFWDCGEFIAAAFKLEVGHPPGAPLFMIIARFFANFAFGDVTKVAVMINSMSALASAFTILFLFWSITHLARKYFAKENGDAELTMEQVLVIIGTGAIGALAYTFSDSFWFSAVEGEVYAMSSLFTAVVFWAILKWENVADEKYANRWLILIAYLMGLSIGVHLLNLLTIPAIVFIYYFRKYKVTKLGIVLAFLTSVVILGTVQYGIVQGVVAIAAKFDLIFVNSFNLPFFSGVAVFAGLLLIGIVFGIWYTHKKNMPILNTIIVGFTVICIGYSSYATIVIRSQANPPMDENSPDNMFSLLSYLDREQYGDRPLLYGAYYNAPIVDSKIKYTYIAQDGKYVKIATTNPEYVYDPNFMTFFPRMYSHSDNHEIGYRSWANITSPEKEKPSFFGNVAFFINYQIGYMYFRYFMWNFAGRQNDLQGYGGYQKGNWYSGIYPLDALRLGPQSKLPESMKSNKGMNKYYMLPLLLGMLGLFFTFVRQQKDFWVILLFFFFTGLAIVLYLNQTPFQPRERDYAYAGSFYAFAIWIGFGVMSIYVWAKQWISGKNAAIAAIAISTIVPTILVAQNWDDHDRSGRYTARDLAINYLESCEPNAILFTYGDNDTFPLWYVQDVEGVRTDVRVVNLSLLSADWYIDQMKRKAYESEPVPFSLTLDKFIQGKRDLVPLIASTMYMLNEKYVANRYNFEGFYKKLYEEFIGGIKSSKFSEEYKSDYEVLLKGYQNISPVKFISLVNNLSQKENIEKLNINNDFITNLKTGSDSLLNLISESPLLMSDAMDFLASDSPERKVGVGTPDEMNFIPSKKFIIPVDKKKVLSNKSIPKNKESQLLSHLEWNIPRSYITKSDMMIFDLIATNNWERPVYFATSIGSENFLYLDDYLQLEGFAYRLVPYRTKNENKFSGSVYTDKLYENLMTKFKWGRMNEPDFMMDSNVERVLSIIDVRDIFNRAADALVKEGDNKRAIEILDRCIALMPNEKVKFDYSMLPLIENYYLAKAPEKANQIVQTMLTRYANDMEYYTSLEGGYYQSADRERQTALAILNNLLQLSKKYNQTELTKKLTDQMGRFVSPEQMKELL